MVGDFVTTSDFHAKKKPPTMATFIGPGDFQNHQRLATIKFFQVLATIKNFHTPSDYEKDTEKSRFRNTQI